MLHFAGLLMLKQRLDRDLEELWEDVVQDHVAYGGSQKGQRDQATGGRVYKKLYNLIRRVQQFFDGHISVSSIIELFQKNIWPSLEVHAIALKKKYIRLERLYLGYSRAG